MPEYLLFHNKSYSPSVGNLDTAGVPMEIIPINKTKAISLSDPCPLAQYNCHQHGQCKHQGLKRDSFTQ